VFKNKHISPLVVLEKIKKGSLLVDYRGNEVFGSNHAERAILFCILFCPDYLIETLLLNQ
jgi:hypothetical protein